VIAGYVRVCGVEDVSEGIPTAFSVAGAEDPERLLIRLGADLFALSRICPHESGDLSEGLIDGGILWCPVHSSGFDCRSGAVVHPPAARPLETYDVRIEGGEVYVRVRGTEVGR
jgi:3-phenylpropionate/trans-cinnamate dioxygenase ferredoxin subunit